MKILYVTTIGITMNFFKELIKELIEEGHTVDLACNEDIEPVNEFYDELGCKKYNLSCTRSPFDKNNIKAVKEIKEIVANGEYDIVHCHTPIAAACTRLACRKLRTSGLRVFYTAHGFHFYKGAPLKNWLIFYPVEKLCSNFTDVLITINHEDFARAKKKFKAGNVEYVPGVGIDVDKFKNAVVDKAAKRREIGVPEDAFLLASVGELNANKNHEVVIRAMAQLNDKNIHYIIAGIGALKEYLNNLADELGIGEQVHLLGYRNDVPELYKSSDVCCFPSIREGLGLAAIEGIATGLPLICADNRGTRDIYKAAHECIMCRYDSVNEFVNAIVRMTSRKKVEPNDYMLKSSGINIFDIKLVINYIKNSYEKKGV